MHYKIKYVNINYVYFSVVRLIFYFFILFSIFKISHNRWNFERYFKNDVYKQRASKRIVNNLSCIIWAWKSKLGLMKISQHLSLFSKKETWKKSVPNQAYVTGKAG